VFPIKKLVALDQELVDAIERIQREEDPIPNQSEAIRRILRDWLIGHEYLKP
jgi:metal-responsive CopG/Arc/MetJ family transcriptional regulator